MRVVVDFERCMTNAICVGVVPDVFEVGDDNCLRVLVDEPGEEFRQAIEVAVSRCPTQAISLEG